MKDTSKEPETIADEVIERELFEKRVTSEIIDGRWMNVKVESVRNGYLLRFSYGNYETQERYESPDDAIQEYRNIVRKYDLDK